MGGSPFCSPLQHVPERGRREAGLIKRRELNRKSSLSPLNHPLAAAQTCIFKKLITVTTFVQTSVVTPSGACSAFFVFPPPKVAFGLAIDIGSAMTAGYKKKNSSSHLT
jgi:hypothetical protein